MNTVSLVGSVSRRAGGLFESVRRLHQELVREPLNPENRKLDVGGCRSENISVNLMGTRDEFTDFDIEAWDPVPVQAFSIRGPRSFGYAPGLSGKLLAMNPDLLHVHGLWQYSSVVAFSWHRTSRRPYVVSPHGMLDPWAWRHSAWKKRLAWLVFERNNLRAATCIRALCRSEANSIRALGLSNPVCIIPNGVDLPRGAVEGRPEEKLGRGKLWQVPGAHTSTEMKSLCCTTTPSFLGPKVLLYLGRLHPKKGLATLLRAWAKVATRNEWVLVIVGWDQGGHEAELKRLACELEIRWADARREPGPGTSVVFVGPQFGTAKRQWLQRCDAFILPSFGEGVPMAVLEAWAHAKPVLMTPQCNLPEGFTAGAAIAIEPNPEAVAAGLQVLFRTRCSALESMGLLGRGLVAKRFAWPKIVADLKAVYKWAAGGGSKPNCVLSQ